MIERLLTRLFKLEEINGANRCPTYLYRWTLFQPRWPKRLWRGFGVYIHKFVGDDWSRDLHDHPKRFISIGLKGRYIEETLALGHHYKQGMEPRDRCMAEDLTPGLVCGRPWKHHQQFRTYTAPWARTFPATHRHRLMLMPKETCWTLVVVLWAVRDWGFWPRGTWVHFKDYVKPGNKDADDAKACP